MTSPATLLKITTITIVIVMALISFHAPISVYFGTLFPAQDLLIKSWKEILIGAATILFLPVALKNGIVKRMIRDKLFVYIGAFAVLHLVILGLLFQGSAPSLAGLLIDLRYFLFFGLVYGLVLFEPTLRPLILKTVLMAAIVVIIFGFLQIVLLPQDILSHIGYGKTTIAPYLRVDENPDFVRINSTLRGPNPLGLYAAGLLTICLSFLIQRKGSPRLKRYFFRFIRIISFFSPLVRLIRNLLLTGKSEDLGRRRRIILGILSLIAIVVLWHSYSRSALLAAIVGTAVVLAVRFSAQTKRYWLAGSAVILIICLGLFLAYKDSSLLQQVVFHNDPLETNVVNSDQQHASSLASGWNAFIKQPLGAGVGSTGSASLLGEQPNIIENQYLFVAHESGWLGLGLFIVIFGLVLRRLFAARKDYLSLGMFASGVGLVFAGLVLPVFADDTIALLWWGLAAVALASSKRVIKI